MLVSPLEHRGHLTAAAAAATESFAQRAEAPRRQHLAGDGSQPAAVLGGSGVSFPELWAAAASIGLCSVLFALGGVILPFARIPEQQGDPNGGQGHHTKRRPVQLEGEIGKRKVTTIQVRGVLEQ